MKTLGDILKEYRGTCFLVKDHGLTSNTAHLMALQDIVTEDQLNAYFKALTNDEYEAAYNRGGDDPVYVALVKIREKLNQE
jgi:hypothetical protein